MRGRVGEGGHQVVRLLVARLKISFVLARDLQEERRLIPRCRDAHQTQGRASLCKAQFSKTHAMRPLCKSASLRKAYFPKVPHVEVA